MGYTRALLFLLLPSICSVAHADGDPLCRAYITDPVFFSHPAAVKYVKTGVIEAGSKLDHSREFYAAILGMTDDLTKLLASRDKTKPFDRDILFAVAGTGYTESLRLLLDAGIPADYTAENEATALGVAAQCKEPVMMSYLLAAGANLYVHPANVGDAMQAAVFAHFYEGIEMLLAAGYDPLCATYHASRGIPESMANRMGDKKAASLLEGAREIRARSTASQSCPAAVKTDRPPMPGRG